MEMTTVTPDMSIKTQKTHKQRWFTSLLKTHQTLKRRQHKNKTSKWKRLRKAKNLTSPTSGLHQHPFKTRQRSQPRHFAIVIGFLFWPKLTKMRTCHRIWALTCSIQRYIPTYTGILPYGISRYKIRGFQFRVTHLAGYLFVRTAKPPGKCETNYGPSLSTHEVSHKYMV